MLSNSKGFITNAIYGFYNMLYKVIEEEKPQYIAVAFDKGKIVFRHQEFAEYKGKRKGMPDELRPQFPVLKELLKALNIAIFEVDGYEADDIIGTLVKMAEEKDIQSIVLTGDRDALQLVSEKTKVYLTKKGITEVDIFDQHALMEKYSLIPERIIDLKGLMGDASDNIPGIPGVGEKTALKLLHQHDSLENALACWKDYEGKKLGKLLQEYAEQARMSKKLATILTDVPLDIEIDICQAKTPDYPKVVEMVKDLEFKNILQKILHQMSERADENIEENIVDRFEGRLINSIDELSDYVTKIKSDITFYFEFVKKSKKEAAIKRLAIKECNEFPILLESNSEEFIKMSFLKLKPVLENENIKKTIYDVKNTTLTLEKYDISLKGVFYDTLLMAYILEPSQLRPSPVHMAMDQCGINIPEEGQNRYFALLTAFEKMGPMLWEQLKEQEMLDLYRDLELPLANVLALMEKKGVILDSDVLEEMGNDINIRIEKISEEIYEMAGEKFNLNSPKQLGVILFEKLELPKGKKTKTGYSTSAEVLESLASKHEIVAKILYYRQIAKLKSTYIDGLRALINPDTKRVYTSFNQTITATGRLSSTDPNLQNIPIRMEEGRLIRRAFKPTEGNVLLSADYSQIELRVLAHMAADEVLLEAFHSGQDIHTRTAAEVFGVGMDEVDKDMRRAAKAVNFGIVYGISDYGLSRDLGIARSEAKEYIEQYFKRYQGVKKYIESVIAEARERGYVETILKRRRYLPDILSRNFHLRSFAERTAMNTPIQGSAADIIKLAMLKIQDRIEKEMPECQMILQVHDELIFDVSKNMLDKAAIIVNKEMSEAYPLAVPLKVDLQHGINWYEMKRLEL